jgi:sugar phosphate isomerase/epimerase
MPAHPVYLATVALERNRWGSREPSLRVSDWIERIARDGFDGIELWANHFLAADDDERSRLIERAARVAVFNTYAGFGDSPADAAHRDDAVAAVALLRAGAVKFNLGPNPAQLDTYRRNLLMWSAQLPEACVLLCECHPGTVMENADIATAFLAELDPARFGAISHVTGDADRLAHWATTLGPRMQHLHLQLRSPEDDPATPAGQRRLNACVSVLDAHGFRGGASVEFTRGIGRDEQIETLYANARADMMAYRAAWETL